MMNLKDFTIDLSEISINCEQMKNATEVAVKAAISSAMIIADQVVLDGYKKIHLAADNVEIIVNEDIVMIVTKENTIVADIDHLASMEYNLVNFNLSQLTELLNALVKLGERFKKGNVEFEYDFVSKGLELADSFLEKFSKTNMNKHIIYQNHTLKISSNEITMDGKTLLHDGVYYYYEWATRILLELVFREETKQNKYDVLFGKSNEDIKEWPPIHK